MNDQAFEDAIDELVAKDCNRQLIMEVLDISYNAGDLVVARRLIERLYEMADREVARNWTN